MWGLGITAFGLASDLLWLAFVCLAVAGAADVISAVFRGTILQQSTPDALRGRLSSLNIVVVAGGPRLGDFEAGLVASLTTPTISVVSGGLACVAGVVVIAAVVPEFARYEAPSSGAEPTREPRFDWTRPAYALPMPHPDDEFHPPTSDDPYWTETCWFTFAVPERRLSAQLYPFFRPNQGVCAAGAYAWDDTGDQPWNARYAKNFWHLPMPDAPLSDIQLPNGIRYRCVEPLSVYELGYIDPDDDSFEVELVFRGTCPPNPLGESHLDQPGRYAGVIRLEGEEMSVDAYGMRDRSWGPRSQFGAFLHSSGAARGGYSYATASESDGFHAITMDFGNGCIAIHGYVLRAGRYARVAAGRREVLARRGGAPARVALSLTDELGRTLEAEGTSVNRLGLHLNPNLFTWNCLTEWRWDGATGWGEDHDNWSATGARRFFADPANRDGVGRG